jgi:rhamnogalacturonan endolyase
LSKAQFNWQPGEPLAVNVELKGPQIRAQIGDNLVLQANDSTYKKGKIGITANVPAKFSRVKVTTSSRNKQKYESERETFFRQEKNLQVENPELVVWKKISTEGFDVSRNLRFGDLDNDGTIDVLIGRCCIMGQRIEIVN